MFTTYLRQNKRLTKSMVIAVGVIAASLMTGTVAFAALDYVETDEECSNGQELWSFIDTGLGTFDGWVTLDNYQTHGWAGGVCDEDDGSCSWLYRSGDTPSNRSVIAHAAWSENSVFIAGFQCVS